MPADHDDPSPALPVVVSDGDCCRTVRLAQSEVAAVDRCACGMLRLHLGALTLRFTPQAFAEVLGTLGEAWGRATGSACASVRGEVAADMANDGEGFSVFAGTAKA